MKVIWEHARRNFALRAEGELSIVCPIADGSGVSGIGIFNADVEATKRIMDEDPAVKSGHISVRGTSLPELSGGQPAWMKRGERR